MDIVDDDDDFYPERPKPWDSDREPGWDMVNAAKQLRDILKELGMRSSTREENNKRARSSDKKPKTKPRQDT